MLQWLKSVNRNPTSDQVCNSYNIVGLSNDLDMTGLSGVVVCSVKHFFSSSDVDNTHFEHGDRFVQRQT